MLPKVTWAGLCQAARASFVATIKRFLIGVTLLITSSVHLFLSQLNNSWWNQLVMIVSSQKWDWFYSLIAQNLNQFWLMVPNRPFQCQHHLEGTPHPTFRAYIHKRPLENDAFFAAGRHSSCWCVGAQSLCSTRVTWKHWNISTFFQTLEHMDSIAECPDWSGNTNAPLVFRLVGNLLD